MTQPSVNELSRAIARPDIADLRQLLKLHHRWSARDRSGEAAPDDQDEDYVLDAYLALGLDPDRALAFVILAAATYDDPEYLFLTAAGPLEEILGKADPATLKRVANEARRTPRFRWMLTGLFLHAVRDDAVRRVIADAIGDVRGSDPMPPAPWA